MGELKTYATHFASVGGACCGIEQAGLECVSAVEKEQDRVDFRAQHLGHRGVCMDIRDYKPSPSDAADLLWTSPPCKAASQAKRSYVDPNDPINLLYKHSVEYCKLLRPKYVVLENVLGVLTFGADKVGKNLLSIWRKDFEALGYHTEFNILNSKYFGCPQDRERVFMVGSLEGKKGLIPAEKRTIKTTFGAIWERGAVRECWSPGTYMTVISSIARNSAKNGSPYGFRFVADEKVIADVMESVGKEAGQALKSTLLNIFPTITCSFDGGATRKKVAVIDQKDGLTYLRQPTVKEGARAQGFPDSWVWPDNRTLAWNYIGDAVSCPVSKAIVEHLMRLERGEKSPAKRELTGKRIAGYVRQVHNEMFEEMEASSVDPADMEMNEKLAKKFF